MESPLPSHRDLFEIPRDIAYFNNASHTPIPRPVRAAGEEGVASKSHPWLINEAADEARLESVRAAAARLIGAQPQDMAIVPSVAYAMATAAANIPTPRGTRILLIEGEFPSVALTFARAAEEQGAILDIVRRPPDHDWTAALAARITDPALPPISLAALTPLIWSEGTAIDLNHLAPLLHAQGAALVIDATQAAGVLDLDIARLRPDFMAFPSYKWLLGPYTLAFLYVAPHRQAGRPFEHHRAVREGGMQAFRGQMGPLVQGATRFDMGERLNPMTLRMGLAGMTLLEQWGRAPLAARMRTTTDALATAAESAGFHPIPRPHRTPHILGIPVPDAEAAIRTLSQSGVHAAARLGTLRLGAHIFNDEEDIARVTTALTHLART